MRKKLFTTWGLLCFLLAASCTQDDVDDPTLALSQQFIEFEKSAGEKSITVATNQVEWDAFATDSWITLNRNRDKLTVKTTGNPNPAARKTTVIVTAGGLIQKVEVTQTDGDLIIEWDAEETAFDPFETTRTVHVIPNTGNWTAETDAGWITVDAAPLKNEITLTVKENPDREPRTGYINVKSGDKIQTVEITQQGAMYYILPFLQQPVTWPEIEKFETARRNRIIESAPDNMWRVMETNSPAFTRIRYVGITNLNYNYSEIEFEPWIYWIDVDVSSKEVIESPGFEEFMNKNSFTLIKKTTLVNGYDQYWYNQDNRFTAYVRVTDDGVKMQYFYNPLQPQAYPTLETYPIPYIDFNTTYEGEPWTVYQKKFEAVKEYEAQRGGIFKGIFDSENDDNLRGSDCGLFDVPLPECHRAYYISFVTPIQLKAVRQFFPGINQLMWKTPAGLYYATVEFEQLLQKEGFIRHPDYPNPLDAIYINNEKQISMRLMVYNDFNIPYGLMVHSFRNNGNPVVVAHIKDLQD